MMIVSLFRKIFTPATKKSTDELLIEKNIADFKKNPESWDENEHGNIDEIHNRILTRLMVSIPSTKSKPKSSVPAWIAAASIILIALASLYFMKVEVTSPKLASRENTIILKTGKYEVRKIILSDRSIVWVNRSSTVRYPKNFDKDKRRFELVEGEAFFDVKHEKDRPFQVKAGKTLTNVLGTAFNISSYSWKKTINIIVKKGKVAVNNQILLPNDELSYQKSTGNVHIKKLKSVAVTSWIEGKIIFESESLTEVASFLRERFHVEIHLANDQVAQTHFTGRFEPTESLNEILDALSMTTGLYYQAKGNVITITTTKPTKKPMNE
ncbi:FecR family protein [Pedobacter sp. MW01-1-1]|uniref:FecR family protein n=1 Tax=Pedobacter sp. MW01-1-1 TaxID=3383027 RepID=UPI003FEDAE29